MNEMNESGVSVVRRIDVPLRYTIRVDGKMETLGILRDFRQNVGLRQFFPKDARLSVAWVHLDLGQTLNPHVHPVDSMIIVCQGCVLSTGEYEGELSAGDTLLVPAGHVHGLVGAGDDGFWGLSVQFEPRGLYEDERDPWATFVGEGPPAAAATTGPASPIDDLLARNERLLEKFATNRLFTLVKRGDLNDATARGRFLDCFQVWSNCFQQMVQARLLFLHDARFRAVAQQHLDHELGHNTALERGRPDLRAVWDPVLESTASWFVWKMARLSDVERLVVVHLVVEASAIVFYKNVAPLAAFPEMREHLDAHDGADEEHVRMGIELLRTLPLGDPAPLFEIQSKAWDVLHTMFGRIADLAAR